MSTNLVHPYHSAGLYEIWFVRSPLKAVRPLHLRPVWIHNGCNSALFGKCSFNKFSNSSSYFPGKRSTLSKMKYINNLGYYIDRNEGICDYTRHL